jgi:hypothetical protein
MKKVVSMALFGHNPGHGDNLRSFWYGKYLPAVVRAHHSIFKKSEGWELRLHVDPQNYGGLPAAYAARGLLELKLMQPAPLTQAMLWRMLPVFDESVSYVFCRDIDALPTPRDKTSCDKFIKSGCDIFIQSDSCSHLMVMGGMGGYRVETFVEITGIKSFSDLCKFGESGVLQNSGDWSMHGVDQDVLNALVYNSEVGRNLVMFEHRWAGWDGGKPGKVKAEPSERALISELLPNGDGDIRDSLVSHLGATGFDLVAAIDYYDKHGEESLIRTVKEAEADA